MTVTTISTTQLQGTLQAGQFPALTGDISTSAGSLATTIGAAKVSNAMLAGSIAASKLIGSDIATVGTITSGTWNGTVIGLAQGGTNANLTANTGGIFYSGASAGAILSGTATASKMLLSGATSAPTWSTSTIPTSAGSTAGKVLLSDGTNYILSTPTFPNTSATSGKIVVSDGTNWIASTPTYPNTSGTAGKIIRSDGTNNAYSTATFADTYTASNLLYSNGTNTVTGLATAANGILTTDGSGVPSITASIPSVTNITMTGNNGYIGTGTSAGNNVAILVYDTDNLTYRTFILGTAGVIPTLAITSPAGGSTTIDNVVIGGTTAVAGTFTTVTSTTLTNTIATAGATVTTTTSNSNNSNAASNATSAVTTGGASAGDPVRTWTVTGATTWAHGIDNSDSDKLKENPSGSLGSGDTRIVTTAGQQTMPLQPAFLAYASVSQTSVTGDNSTVNVIFGAELFDIGSNFASNTFTAPVTGIYKLGCNLIVTGLTSSHTSLIAQIVTTNNTFQVFACNAANMRNTGNNAIVNGCIVAQMTAGDTATVQLNVSGGTKVVGLLATIPSTNFYGVLLC